MRAATAGPSLAASRFWSIPPLTTGPEKQPRGAARSVPCASLARTKALAEVVAQGVRVGDVVLFDGPLAAGKTTFVSFIIRALGCDGQVSSPTYAISNVYACGGFDVFHIDAYRLADLQEFHDLGIDEFFPEALVLIEWGERVAEVFPEHLRIRIDFDGAMGEARRFDFQAQGARWQPLIDRLSGFGGS